MINIYLIIFLIITLILHIVIFIIKKGLKRKKIINTKLPSREKIVTDFNLIKNLSIKNENHTILIVEDDLANRKILQAQLETAKFKVITANDGHSAIKTIEENAQSIDIVLLDLLLPDISGFSVCQIIRKKLTIYQLPIIMVTSQNYVKDLIEGFNSGANDFVTKPYNIYELVARIHLSITLKNIFKDNSSLKKINKLKSDIVDMAAHDMKSPLTIISGYANRILKTLSKESLEFEYTNKIITSSNKMLKIINKLLNDSKYENQQLIFENINIIKTISDSIDFYTDMARNKSQKINFYYLNSMLYLYIDKNSISTIIDNLISNAIKYSPVHSHINITVEDFKERIEISIKDSGNGFTDDEIDNLFIKYFPFTNKPTQGENSTGLGLYIINDMVNRNNGEIKVKSVRGEGSEFKLIFQKE